MSARILLVDDDPPTLQMGRRALERSWATETAANGQAALNALSAQQTFDVVVCDLSLPDMSGLSLLSEFRRLAPDTVRVLLTGASDPDAPIEAMNSGRVFRYLKKPCSAETLVGAVGEALTEHAELVRNRAALIETCEGAVHLLANVLAEIDATAVTAGQRLAERAKELAARLEAPFLREYEAAALLLRVGLIGLPVSVNAKLRAKRALTAGEADTMRHLPELGAQLLQQIPRLTPIAEIVRYQEKGFDGIGPPVDTVRGTDIPFGARLLRPLVDLQAIESGGLTSTQAMKQMQRHACRYDPQVLGALTSLADEWTTRGNRRLEARLLSELREGMELDRDVTTEDGLRVAAAGALLTEAAIERLRAFAEQGQIRDTVFVVVDESAIRR